MDSSHWQDMGLPRMPTALAYIFNHWPHIENCRLPGVDANMIVPKGASKETTMCRCRADVPVRRFELCEQRLDPEPFDLNLKEFIHAWLIRLKRLYLEILLSFLFLVIFSLEVYIS
jgi:hypothetical protein